MSSPAISCARRCVDTASSYCSRQRALTMASRKLRWPSDAVCHAGRGSEPMIDVGSTVPADALYMAFSCSPCSGPGGELADQPVDLAGFFHMRQMAGALDDVHRHLAGDRFGVRDRDDPVFATPDDLGRD